MAATSTAVTTKVESGSPYQLDTAQVSRAASALIQHIKSQQQQAETQAGKKSLLAGASNASDEEDTEEDDVPVWLIITTKKHIVDQKRLKPSKIILPHPIYNSPNQKILLITADPQRAYKDVVAHSAFPSALREQIGRVIGIEKLKKRYKSFESKRQLLSEYGLFLADERIITYLPPILGKTFYKGSKGRPIPVSLTGNLKRLAKDAEGKKPTRSKEQGKKTDRVGAPADVARDIERTLRSALIHLSPSATTAVKVAKASFEPAQVAANVEAVVNALVEKRTIPQGFRNIRSIHIKGPNTTALPVWLAEELWVDEADVLDEKWKPDQAAEEAKKLRGKGRRRKAIEEGKVGGEGGGKKRKVEAEADEEQKVEQPKKKSKKGDVQGDDISKEIAMRKEKLKKQKAEAMAEVDGSTKKAGKRKELQAVDGEEVKRKSKKTKAT